MGGKRLMDEKLSERKDIPGLVVSDINWSSVSPVPSFRKEPIREFFDINQYRRDFRDEFLRGIGMDNNMTKYQVAIIQSQDPAEDGFYSQMHIWYDHLDETQTKPFGDLIADFIEREHEWYKSLRAMGENEAFKAVYGRGIGIESTLWLNFAMMRESFMKDCKWHIEYRIWSYPHITAA